MQIIRTIVWVLLLVALLLFSVNNWKPAEVTIWNDIIWQTKLPAVAIISFLLGLLPMWLLHKTAAWRLRRRIGTLENSVRAASVAVPVAPAPAPVVTTTTEPPLGTL